MNFHQIVLVRYDIKADYELSYGDEKIEIAESKQTQMLRLVNRVRSSLYRNDGSIISENGRFEDKYFFVEEEYDICYPPSMYDFLAKNYPENNNESFWDKNVEPYCTVNNKFIFSENGSVTVESKVVFL